MSTEPAATQTETPHGGNDTWSYYRDDDGTFYIVPTDSFDPPWNHSKCIAAVRPDEEAEKRAVLMTAAPAMRLTLLEIRTILAPLSENDVSAEKLVEMMVAVGHVTERRLRHIGVEPIQPSSP